MKTEMEKCLAGEWYDCHDPFFMDLKSKAHHLLMKYNSLPYEQKTEKYALLKEMFGSIGANVSVGHSFICDYGCNIHIGDNVTVNTGCTFVDCNKITIGNNVLVAPNVQIYTATHPVEFNERLVWTETPDGCKYVRRTFAFSVMIEDGCWIGGGVIILPGVTIGQKSVIGAGSVVTKDIPANSLAVGNPCRVIRKIIKCRVMIKLVAFDLDGTIGDTIPMCLKALRKAVTSYVTPNDVSENDILETFGLNEKGMIRKLVGYNWENALDDFYVIYEQMHIMCPRPFNGITELIEKLKKKSIPIALVTGKGEKSCAITLRQFNMDTCFDKVKTGNPFKNNKAENFRELLADYKLQPDEMIYIGDTVSDIVSCREVGIRCLSASWVTSCLDAQKLEAHNAGNVFNSIASLECYLICKIVQRAVK